MVQKNDTKKPGLRQEALSVFGIFISLFLFLSLFTSAFGLEKKWCGEIGLIVAGLLLGFTGWGAYLLPVLILILSFLFITPRLTFERLPQVTAGLTGTIISFCGLLSCLAIRGPELIETGGFIGRTGFTMLQSVVGDGGTVMVFLLLFLVSLMLTVQFSLYKLVAFIWQRMQKAAELFKRDPEKQEIEAEPKVVKRRSVVRNKKEKEVVEQPGAMSNAVPELNELISVAKADGADEEFAAKPVARGPWELPPLSLLKKNEQAYSKVDKEVYYKLSKQLEQKLKNFGVSGKVIGISPGPVVTTYEYAPAPGVKINKIVGLADDLALGLKVRSVRVVGSVPGKAALGVEIPNDNRAIVYIRDLLGSEDYRKSRAKLSIALGMDVVGNLSTANLARMPHLLIAGATGAGKSVGINTIIASILYNATPEEVRFLLVDPKRIELSGYEGIPHLLHPVVVDPKLASRALNWAVREMERRYKLLEESKVKSFDSYNESAEEKLPYIVIVVDELADLMMVASKDVEAAIARLAQMARAAGMHLILATQRPSVDVLTGLIKANFPTRISFKVSSKIDSRTILDTSGAEHLLGAGDMLLLAPGTSRLKRIHGAYISEKETSDIVEFWKKQGGSTYDEAVIEEIEREKSGEDDPGDEEYDERYDEAVAIVTAAGQASISMVQRRMRVGYNRAARMIEKMEKEGVIGPADGVKPRQVIVREDYV
ncbi:MAG: DNA translocase FtsK 4TM domain-containing protein [Deltaproteobacteria bacterium]|nr:DNA translocase FtsK 4TM domain-containing protein [Deltaproteobacteria bacterium]